MERTIKLLRLKEYKAYLLSALNAENKKQIKWLIQETDKEIRRLMKEGNNGRCS